MEMQSLRPATGNWQTTQQAVQQDKEQVASEEQGERDGERDRESEWPSCTAGRALGV